MSNKTLLALPLIAGFCGFANAADAILVPDGYVVRVESATVYLDWGKSSAVQVGGRFSLYRVGEDLKHPVTGEMLGKTQLAVGAGTLQSIDAKFSVGLLDSPKGGKGVVNVPQIGDRSHWQTAPSSAAVTLAVETALVQVSASLKEAWRSEPLEKDPVGLTFADLDGDGKKDIVVAYHKKIQAYRWKDKKLEPLATFEDRSYRHWLAIDAGTVRPDGSIEIFATTYINGLNRARIVVLRFENNTLKKTAEFEGFARVIPRLDGRRPVYWQGLSRSRMMSFTGVSELTWEKDAHRPGRPLDVKMADDQLFGFAWGDWDQDGQEDFAVLEHGVRLRIGWKELKWRSKDVYGRTKNDFSYDDNTQGVLFPRLINWRPLGADRDQLIVSTNFPELGINMNYLKVFKRSEIEALTWADGEMKPVWKISIQGYLADFGIGDVGGESKPQLWTAVAGPGDKTILISFTLP